MAKIKQEWLPLFRQFLQHVRINSKEVNAIDERGAPLDLWKGQRMALNAIVKGLEDGVHNFMFCKGRQQGISTIFECLAIFWLAIHNGMMGAMVIDREENRNALRAKITHYMNSFPKGFFGKSFTIVSDNKDFMLFSNGSRMDFLVAGSRKKEHWGEGRGYAFVHASECSKYGSPKGIANFRETLSEANPQRLYIWESTSKGMNHWKEMAEEFKRDTFGKRVTFIGWWAKELNQISKTDPRFTVYGVADPDPYERELIEQVFREYKVKISDEQLAWYRYKCSDDTVTIQDMAQNHPWTMDQSFVATGYSFFSMPQLGEELIRCQDIPYKGFKYIMGNDFWQVKCEQIYDINRRDEIVLRVWEEPDENATYSIGCDPAYGRSANKDNHNISVWRCFGDKMLQVAEYADNATDTRQCAWVLSHLAGAYKNCLMNPEITGPGGVLMNELDNLRERMRIDPKFDQADKKNENWDDFLSTARWYLWKKPDQWSASSSKGFNTNWKTKVELMELTRDKFITNQLIIRSTDLIEEMMRVIRDGDTIEAPSPLHDDRVIGMALAVRAWSDSLQMGLLGQGVTYEDYIREINGEPLDNVTKLLNNAIRDYMNKKAEEAETPALPAHLQFLYDRGLM